MIIKCKADRDGELYDTESSRRPPPMTERIEYLPPTPFMWVVAVDLGSQNDSTAITILEVGRGYEVTNWHRWDGCYLGQKSTVWERISAADTLIYIDLPIMAHYWGVTRRFAAGLFQTPKGWPGNSPMWESTLDGYRVIWLCHRGLTPKYRQRVAEAASSKQVHHLTSRDGN